MQEQQNAEQCAELLSAMADPDRLMILRALRERPQSVTDLSALLDKEIGNVSHHLKVLRLRGLVASQRQGRSIIYSLSREIAGKGRSSVDRFDLGCCRVDFK